jgi:hypothetical protein
MHIARKDREVLQELVCSWSVVESLYYVQLPQVIGKQQKLLLKHDSQLP